MVDSAVGFGIAALALACLPIPLGPEVPLSGDSSGRYCPFCPPPRQDQSMCTGLIEFLNCLETGLWLCGSSLLSHRLSLVVVSRGYSVAVVSGHLLVGSGH